MFSKPLSYKSLPYLWLMESKMIWGSCTKFKTWIRMSTSEMMDTNKANSNYIFLETHQHSSRNWSFHLCTSSTRLLFFADTDNWDTFPRNVIRIGRLWSFIRSCSGGIPENASWWSPVIQQPANDCPESTKHHKMSISSGYIRFFDRSLLKVIVDWTWVEGTWHVLPGQSGLLCYE